MNMMIMIMMIMIIYSFSAESQNSIIMPMAKPNCVDRCGEISIPYPAGTTPDCYLNPIFMVTCNYTFNPPKLFWQTSNQLEITDISLDGQTKIMQYVGRDCYARNGTRARYTPPMVRLLPLITVNNTANKFTMVGCDAEASISGWRRNGRKFRTGCSATCGAEDDLTEGSCMGLGCCQTSIPADVTLLEVDLRSYSNYSEVWDFNNCTHAFLVEETAFAFSPENLTNLKNVRRLPFVVDWAVGNTTCAEAQATANYACVSLYSGCYDPPAGYGYRCRCYDGYQGNPYLANGCQDIDECGDSNLNECTKKEYCTNTAGNYTCSCPKGYSGNGRGKLDGCNKKHHLTILYILIGTSFGICSLLLVTIILYLQHKRKSSQRLKNKYFLQNGGILLQEKLTRTRGSLPNMVKIFGSSDLHKATKDFHNSVIIGQGGFGTVYRGELLDKTIVAIKKSKKVDPNQIEQFINEVFVLSQINHRNVVRLLGCCLETEVPLLVYEFVSNGTLSSHLHNKTKARLLNWETRLKIGAETAGVLAYLHSAASTPIIHRDVKPDNILLDQDFTAKVSDFGASKLIPLDLSQLSTMVQGTFGYLDPEYMQTSKLTEKSDVYSFGVVLLELLTGRKAVSFDREEEERSLSHFFLHRLQENRLCEILDVSISPERNMEKITHVANLAKGCLNVRSEARPTMKQVAAELEGLIDAGKRHSWSRNIADDLESNLLTEMNPDNANGERNSINVGYDILGFDSLLLSGGR